MQTPAREPRVPARILNGSLALAPPLEALAADGMPVFLARETEAATISAASLSEAERAQLRLYGPPCRELATRRFAESEVATRSEHGLAQVNQPHSPSASDGF